jgi:hypothetical protein
MLVTVKTCNKKTEQMLTTYEDYGKRSKLSYSSANNVHIHSVFYIHFMNYQQRYTFETRNFNSEKFMGEYVIGHSCLLKHKVTMIHISIKATIIPNKTTIKCTGNFQL